MMFCRIGRGNGVGIGEDIPLISSTRHFKTPHPSASSTTTIAPKISRRRIHSSRDELQSSAESNVNIYMFVSVTLRVTEALGKLYLPVIGRKCGISSGDGGGEDK